MLVRFRVIFAGMFAIVLVSPVTAHAGDAMTNCRIWGHISGGKTCLPGATGALVLQPLPRAGQPCLLNRLIGVQNGSVLECTRINGRLRWKSLKPRSGWAETIRPGNGDEVIPLVTSSIATAYKQSFRLRGLFARQFFHFYAAYSVIGAKYKVRIRWDSTMYRITTTHGTSCFNANQDGYLNSYSLYRVECATGESSTTTIPE